MTKVAFTSDMVPLSFSSQCAATRHTTWSQSDNDHRSQICIMREKRHNNYSWNRSYFAVNIRQPLAYIVNGTICAAAEIDHVLLSWAICLNIGHMHTLPYVYTQKTHVAMRRRALSNCVAAPDPMWKRHKRHKYHLLEEPSLSRMSLITVRITTKS